VARVKLLAEEATVHGNTLRYESGSARDYLGADSPFQLQCGGRWLKITAGNGVCLLA
jgi:hypothetical protein